ncbi:hypothetical protein AAG570_010440 [Ranatra chinensis]|uniref:Putative inorganic phosphate cotransporter n=1 Tax=Ranatra chinensis TaxID=642074 RepID=A0ABD0YMJ2_9HEMI
MFFGLLLAYALRANLSVAIVAMTVYPPENPNFPVLEWTPGEKGMVLSSFFWGYIVLQVPAGLLARRFGPCKLLAGALIASGVLTIVTPVAATKGGWVAVVVTRVLTGLSQGFVYPCVNTHMSKWALPRERSKMFSFAFSGTQVGTMVMMLIGGVLAAGAGGWPSIFYVSGAVGVVWGILCAIFGADSPDQHRTISAKERSYINSALINNSRSNNKMTTPWRDIITSPPLWALMSAHVGNCWGFWTLLTLMPTYISGNGFLSALPYFAMWVTSVLFGIIADYINTRKILPLNVSRKMWNSIAHYGEALALLGLAYLHTISWAIVLLTISIALNSGTYLGYLTNHLDLSPNFAGTLMGITNGISTIASILGPLVSSWIVTDESSVSQWRIVFLISAAIFFVGNTLFIIFGSTEIQKWNTPKEERDSLKMPSRA